MPTINVLTFNVFENGYACCGSLHGSLKPRQYLAQGGFSVDNTLPLTKYLSTTEHEERQIADSMHLCPQPLYL